MAKIGIFKQTPEKYFEYDGDTEILIKFISKDAMGEVIKKSESTAKKLGASASKLYDIFLARAAVHGWRKKDDHNHPGLVLPDNTPYPYSPENRDAVAAQDRAFSSFVLCKSSDSSAFMDENNIVSDLTDDDLRGLEHLIKEDNEKK